MRESLPRRVSRTVRCAARECLRSFRLTSGLERRWSGGLVRRALVRAQRHGIASRRRRGLNSAVMQARFGCQQLRPRGIDVLPLGRRLGRRRQQRTIVRRRDTWVRAVTPVHRDTRASDRVARQKQQERHGKQAHQDTRRCRRHVCGCALTKCSNVRGSGSTDQAPANAPELSCGAAIKQCCRRAERASCVQSEHRQLQLLVTPRVRLPPIQITAHDAVRSRVGAHDYASIVDAPCDRPGGAGIPDDRERVGGS